MLKTVIAVLKVWKWPEYAMKWLRGYQELKRAVHETKKAEAERCEAERKLAEFERDAPTRKRQVEKMDFETRVEKAKRRMVDEQIGKIPEETDEVNSEAMRQIRAESTRDKWRKG